MEKIIIEQSNDKLYDDLLEVVKPYLSDFTGYDEKEQSFNIVLAVKELLGQLEQENKELSKLIKGTKDYTEVCSVCKDEVTIYPNISGRTDYTQNEVECLTLAQIISRKNNLEQKNEELKQTIKELTQSLDDCNVQRTQLKARLTPLEDSYFNGLSSIEIAGLAKKSIRITTYNRQLETTLEEIDKKLELALDIEQTDAEESFDLLYEIQDIITEAIGE